MNRRLPLSFNAFIDETGKTYGQLSVIGYARSGGVGRRKSAMFECVCTCGEIIIVKGQHLRSGHRTMCASCYKIARGDKDGRETDQRGA